jgi:hypothetical protein
MRATSLGGKDNRGGENDRSRQSIEVVDRKFAVVFAAFEDARILFQNSSFIGRL